MKPQTFTNQSLTVGAQSLDHIHAPVGHGRHAAPLHEDTDKNYTTLLREP